jgi:hypothetical protein
MSVRRGARADALALGVGLLALGLALALGAEDAEGAAPGTLSTEASRAASCVATVWAAAASTGSSARGGGVALEPPAQPERTSAAMA